MIWWYILAVLLFSLPGGVSAQYAGTDINSFGCAFRSDLSEDQRRDQAIQFTRWKQAKGSSKGRINAQYTIPVVFHLIESTPTITDEQVQAAVASLNDAFSGSGEFLTDYGVDTGIEFCLAQTSPDGGISSGITRIVSEYSRFDKDLEIREMINLVQWDPAYYLNVWIVEEVNGEALAIYTGRSWWERFGVGGFASGDGVCVSSMSPATLAHECGHYLGLLHTWDGVQYSPCKNDDCLRDGDMVCDTPPDRSVGLTICNLSSCNTDTLSNYSNSTFLTDVEDASNFMDYSSCGDAFTLGQTERMQYHLESTLPTIYLQSGADDVCEFPCESSFSISFESDNKYPLPNLPVTFASETSGAITNFEWYVEQLTGSWLKEEMSHQPVATSANLIYEFPAEGWYSIYLKAWNTSDGTCYVSYSRNIKVSCGVDARFYPDKRIIASKRPDSLFTDSVTFTNRSWGAQEYEWNIRHQPFSPEIEVLPPFVSNDEHLVYLFPEPGLYHISLLASDGSCIDNSNTFSLRVEDPTIDGIPAVNDLFCYNQDSILLTLHIYNAGYDTVNIGTPVSFYDGDPRLVGESAPQLLKTYLLPEIVYGFEGYDFPVFINKNISEISQLYVVFNDTGTNTFPLQFPPDDRNVLSHRSVFPPSSYTELTYNNNILQVISNELFPSQPDLIACEGEHLQLRVEDAPGSATWVSAGWGNLGSTNPLEYTVLSADTIYVSWYGESGCVLADTFNVTVSRPEVVLESSAHHIAKGESVRLSAGGGVVYHWSPTTGLDDSASPSPLASPDSTTIFTVEVTDENGCTSTGEVTVFVEMPAWIPNLFTPNTDGANDYLRVYGLTGVQDVSLQIFNRTGKLVYEGSGEAELVSRGWDGSWQDKSQPVGAYFWQVSGSYLSGKPIYLNGRQSGVIHLVR